MQNIPFTRPFSSSEETEALAEVIKNGKLSGDGPFTKMCNKAICEISGSLASLLTTSCTHALEMAAILLDIGPGDEVIMPSFTFVSTANAFVLRGAKAVFVDIDPETMNISPDCIENAITSRTKAIVPVHYGGVACDMDQILNIASRHQIPIVEDAAQSIGAYYKGKHLGSFGSLGAISFHETKNITCGEGGSILINQQELVERSEIIREKGTNRSRFLRGQVDKYTWVDIGSSYLPSELNAAFLFCQLKLVERVNNSRMDAWNFYFQHLVELANKGCLCIPTIPLYAQHNAHLFYILVKDIDERTRLIDHLKTNGIQATFHYVPLHTSPYGKAHGTFVGQDRYTTEYSERLLRLPLYSGMSESDCARVVSCIKQFYKKH